MLLGVLVMMAVFAAVFAVVDVCRRRSLDRKLTSLYRDIAEYLVEAARPLDRVS